MFTSCFRIALIFFTVMFLPFTKAADPIFKVPFTWSPRGHVMVEAVVNESWSLPMAVDTGAHYAVLPRSAISILNLSDSDITEVTAMTATDTRQLESARLDSITLGGKSVKNQNALLLDLNHLHGSGEVVGVLPKSFISNFNVYFDFASMELAFYDKRTEVAAYLNLTSFDSVEYETESGLIRFPVAINGQPMQAILDTGAGGHPVMNWRGANALGFEKGDKRLRAGREVQGAGKVIRQTKRITVNEFSIASTVTGNTELNILDMPHLEQMIGDKPAVNVGLEKLGLTGLLVDYQNQRLYFSMPSS